MRRKASRVSFRMCPFCVRATLTASTTTVAPARERPLELPELAFASDDGHARGGPPLHQYSCAPAVENPWREKIGTPPAEDKALRLMRSSVCVATIRVDSVKPRQEAPR